MDSRQVMIHLAIWPNVAWIGGILIAFLWGMFDPRRDAEFNPSKEKSKAAMPTPRETSGAHRIVKSTEPTETSDK